jgi:hypothetical protein
MGHPRLESYKNLLVERQNRSQDSSAVKPEFK